ncbi:MAG TPA: succinate dehydrogenase, cytochrome b556 subunit [Chloroflexota bacterium]|nr:succinate dehydrogenase, cytochrome b556 subunit [Chloroflexota bacterium]
MAAIVDRNLAEQTARYGRDRVRTLRNREGQWAWWLHRLSGLGVLAFLCLHIVDTSLMLQGEAAYNHLIKSVYQQWWFQPAEVALGGALVYHTLNGLRVIAIDFWEDAIRHERLIRRGVLVAFFAIMAPLTVVMIWPFVR